RARLKFVVAKFGIERFRELVAIERNKLTEEQLGTEQIRDFDLWTDRPLFPPGESFPETEDPALQQWLRTNTRIQKQTGYSAVKVKVPTGDLTPVQLRGLAQLLRDQVGDTLRIGVDQSLFIRWVSWDRLLEVKQELEVLGLGDARAGGLGDATACPGSDTCKLGITSPRSLSHALDSVLSKYALEPALEDLRIKISGCPNSCAQHHIADIGLFGASRTVNGSAAPHYMLYIGGRPGGMPVAGEKPGSGYGVRITKVPAAWTPEAVDRICGLYLEESEENEPWSNFARRLGRG
ncbi:MAG: nitrite/sulfite reductase, partial [Myxococcota bacterium]|nr:nitrite/sulfite reductase [Myxococcota bacterium]